MAQWAKWLEELACTIGDVIAQDVLRQWFEGVLPGDEAVRAAMRGDGWFPAPSLFPQPWAYMCVAYSQGSPADATVLAVGALTSSKLRTMLDAWVSHEPFASHRDFLEAGLRFYESGDYLAAVSVVLPRVEGIVNCARQAAGLAATTKLVKVFRELDRLGDPELRLGWLGSRTYEGFVGFIDEYFDARFHPADLDAGEKRGRHAHAHGATGFTQYDQRYALQLFLMLDALFFLTTPATHATDPTAR
jgi:hypothetical protein